MLWIRGLIFTVLVPAVVGYFLPSAVDSSAHTRSGVWEFGWIPMAAGAAIYTLCLLRFLAAGGTPAIFFTRPLRLLLGEEPQGLVSEGLYRFSRNPMYVGVLLFVFGRAILCASSAMAVYGCVVFAFFHLVVVFLEEPHLRATRGPSYEVYSREVPRWLGMPGRGR
jgi:protein-S-isoprenylcysteine O-methyltransferase Ste14